jgi:hypothetical protein
MESLRRVPQLVLFVECYYDVRIAEDAVGNAYEYGTHGETVISIASRK